MLQMFGIVIETGLFFFFKFYSCLFTLAKQAQIAQGNVIILLFLIP